MTQNVETTKNYYNGIARGYRELYHQEQSKKINVIKNEFLLKGIVLDLGSGDGVLNTFLSPEITLYSFDLSEELLHLNSNRSELKYCGNAENLPFEDEFFDAIYSFTMIQDTPNKQKVISEMYRVLKRKGEIIISHLHMSPSFEEIKKELEKKFTIIKTIKEEKDIIYVLRKE
jgi:ubiquinone/menaquinone biosynthesis C-methylase UbiE